MTEVSSRISARVEDRRLVLIVGAYLLVYLALWAVLPLWLHMRPPDDNNEQIEWAGHPAWGYSKHPPLPSLLLWLFARVFPSGIALTYALGALDVTVMLIAALLLARETLDSARAWIGVLLITCITFYTRRLHFYNHNTALLAAYAVSLVCLWRAVRTERYGWWAAVGVCWAAGLLSKYQMIVGITSNLYFVWVSRSRESRRWLWGTLLAATTTAVLLIPHVLWLAAHSFAPMNYAAKYVAAAISPTARLSNIAHFTANQITRVAPLGVILGALYWALRRQDIDPPGEAPNDAVPHGREMLAVHAWGPLLIMVLLSLLFGVDLEMHWGTAFLWVLPLWLLATPGGRKLAILRARTMLGVIAIAQVLMMAEFALMG